MKIAPIISVLLIGVLLILGACASPASSPTPAIEDIVATVSPSVVRVMATNSMGSIIGSGMMIDTEGYILTNNHIVAGASSVKIEFSSGKQRTGRVTGQDEVNDLALIKVDGINLPHVILGDSSILRAGQEVIAIGYPLGKELGDDVTVTKGIISAIRRHGVIQIDVAVNPGNSGCPLLNLRGEVVGVVSKKLVGETVENIGFAIPINTVKELLPALKSSLYVDNQIKGDWIIMDSGISEHHLWDVWGTSYYDVFVVGGGGTIIHYDGNKWTLMNSNTNNILRGIYGSSSGLVIGGWKGTVLVYDQDVWKQLHSCTEHDMYNVGGTPTEAFIVGSEANVIRVDGLKCNRLNTGTTKHKYDVWGSSSTNVFVVGVSGTILHYDGKIWESMESGTINPIHGIWGTSHTNVFAVGNKGLIIHYDGQSWKPMRSNTTVTLRDVWGRSPSDVYAVGHEGTVLHYDGNNWVQVTSAKEALASLPAENQHLLALWGTASDIFVVGHYGTILYSGKH